MAGSSTRIGAAALSALLCLTARADCKPADPTAIAAAQRRAGDAEHKADQAESVAVRSGNPGAEARARQARAEAREARRALEALTCAAAAPGR